MKKVYLGDSVYAQFDGYHVVLTTENGLPTNPSNTIALNAEVLYELINYVELLGQHLKKEAEAYGKAQQEAQ